MVDGVDTGGPPLSSVQHGLSGGHRGSQRLKLTCRLVLSLDQDSDMIATQDQGSHRDMPSTRVTASNKALAGWEPGGGSEDWNQGLDREEKWKRGTYGQVRDRKREVCCFVRALSSAPHVK